mgnify:CR=1 FL=1
MNIEYTVRDRYGEPRRYPANPAAELACKLAGTKEITDRMTAAILYYGGTMTIVHQEATI